MSGQTGLGAYFPDRPPTWTEVVVCALAVVSLVVRFLSDAVISWLAVVVGFLAFALALGPGANTRLGTGVGRWFRRIGVAGRAAVIALFVVAVAIAFRWEPTPEALLADAAAGGMIAVVLYLVAYVASTGEVSGWRPDRSRID